MGVNYNYTIKEKIRKLLLFISIYCTQTSFALNLMFPERINSIMIASTLLIFVVLIILYKSIQIRLATILLFVSLCMVLTALTNQHYSGGYVIVIMGFFQAMMFVSAYNRENFYEDYISIMVFLGLFSLVASLLVYNNWLGINGVFPVLINSVGDRYLNFLIAIPSITLSMFRVNGIWGEAGMFGVYLVFALLMELFYVHRPPKPQNIILLLLISILTLSATVFVVIALTCVTYYFTVKRADFLSKLKYIFVLIPIIVIVVLLISYFSPGAFNAVFSKYDVNNISFIGRAAPIVYNISQWTDKPIFGNGLSLNLGEAFELMVFRGQFYRIRFNTTTSLIILNYFGIPMFCLHLFLVFRFSRCHNWRAFKFGWLSRTIVLMIIVLININTQDVELDQTMSLLLMSSFMKEGDNKGEACEGCLSRICDA